MQFRRIANEHSFRVAFRPRRKVQDVKHTCQEPLGESQLCVVYKILCHCWGDMVPFPDKKRKSIWTKLDGQKRILKREHFVGKEWAKKNEA